MHQKVHLKGPSDGLGAAVKGRLQRMILGGKVLNNAYEAYLALVQTQNKESNQRIIYVPQKQIDRQKPPKETGLKTVKGTQSFHMISTVKDQPGQLQCSDLSCSCLVCIAGHEGPCLLQKYRHEPQIHCLSRTVHSVPSSNTNQNAETHSTEHSEDASNEGIEQSLQDYVAHQIQNENSMSIFASRVARKGWQIRGTSPDDGNCCFWAIGDQLTRIGAETYSHATLRTNVVNYMTALPQTDKAEMEKFLTSSVDEYMNAMSKDGTYADHVCLQAMSRMLSTEIHIIHSDNTDVILYPSASSSSKVVLGYLPDIQHYVSLEPLVRFEANDFVGVVLTERRRRHFYIAKVIEVDSDVQLRFLQPTSSEGIYTWPGRDDISWQPQTDVIQKLKPPELVQGRGLKLKFDTRDIDQCKKNGQII